jgi:hydrogenase expression/formation protein HypE
MSHQPLEDAYIGLAHGNGGRYMRELIQSLFARHLGNPELDIQADAVAVDLSGELLVTNDGFSVQPLEFPGGDIGSLAVHGATNDLAVAGAEPRYLTLSAFIEEGLEVALLDRLLASMAHAAAEIGVRVVAGDTKVVPRGEGGGVYFAVTAIGRRMPGARPALNRIRAGDRILVSGPIGDHGIAVMLAREQFGLRGDLRSDSGSVLALARVALGLDGLRFMRDPTRGGLAMICHEILHATGLGVQLQAVAVPVRDAVSSVCEILGYDPYYLACEGRVVAVTAPAQADALLAAWRAIPEGDGAAIIGDITENQQVVLATELGGQRLLDELEDDPLPRIC